MLFHGHCCLPLGTGFCNALSLHMHDKLLTLGASFTQGKVSSIPTIFCWGGSISPGDFLPSILLLVVIIVAVTIDVVTVILVVVIGEAVTFPSILMGNPPMKTSMSFSEFGTIVGHKIANSWNLL
ncbi:hypothetical protein Tco_0129847, partial [Tanacetum coccineum]